MNGKIKWKALIPALAVPLAVGGLSGLLTRDNLPIFSYAAKPPLSPPGWVFPVVWTLLYLMMGTASYLVLESGAPKPRTGRAIGAYAAQLVMNFFWTVIFFNAEAFLLAFIWLALLWLAILLCLVLFARISSGAGWLMAPYLLWTAFAGYLNLGIYLLN